MKNQSIWGGHLVVEAQAIALAEQHRGHLPLRGEVVDLEDLRLVLVADGLIAQAPAAQQHQQRALCAVAHELHGIGVMLYEEGLHPKTEPVSASFSSRFQAPKYHARSLSRRLHFLKLLQHACSSIGRASYIAWTAGPLTVLWTSSAI